MRRITASPLLLTMLLLQVGCPTEQPAEDEGPIAPVPAPGEKTAAPTVQEPAATAPQTPPAGPPRHPAPPPDAAGQGDRWINSQGMEFVFIGPGQFLMGSPEDEEARRPDETQHQVVLTGGFWIAQAEVTQKQWMEIAGYTNARFRGPDLPIDSVSWDDAKDFCRRLGANEGRTYRLPTEAEWEYACRAGTRTPFGLGRTITSTVANIDGTKEYGDAPRGFLRNKTTPVKSFPPNEWGLYDMHGNAWELCADWYGEDYYENAPEQDPKGPEIGERRVVRGGSWRGPASLARAAHRHRAPPDYRHFYFGFRPVMEP